MRSYIYDHVHLRSPDPDATARFFETMFQAEVTPAFILLDAVSGQMRVTMKSAARKC